MEMLSIILRVYDLYKLVVDLVTHSEKKWRYGLGHSLEKSVLDCLEELVMAKNAPKPLKAAYLIRASSHQEVATLKLRLCLEMAIANETKIFQAQAINAEVGRMLGGWLKSVQSS